MCRQVLIDGARCTQDVFSKFIGAEKLQELGWGDKAEGGAEGAPPSPGKRHRMTEKEEDELYMKSAPNRPRLLGPAPSTPLTGAGRLLSAGSKPSRRRPSCASPRTRRRVSSPPA